MSDKSLPDVVKDTAASVGQLCGGVSRAVFVSHGFDWKSSVYSWCHVQASVSYTVGFFF